MATQASLGDASSRTPHALDGMLIRNAPFQDAFSQTANTWFRYLKARGIFETMGLGIELSSRLRQEN